MMIPFPVKPRLLTTIIPVMVLSGCGKPDILYTPRHPDVYMPIELTVERGTLGSGFEGFRLDITSTAGQRQFDDPVERIDMGFIPIKPTPGPNVGLLSIQNSPEYFLSSGRIDLNIEATVNNETRIFHEWFYIADARDFNGDTVHNPDGSFVKNTEAGVFRYAASVDEQRGANLLQYNSPAVIERAYKILTDYANTVSIGGETLSASISRTVDTETWRETNRDNLVDLSELFTTDQMVAAVAQHVKDRFAPRISDIDENTGESRDGDYFNWLKFNEIGYGDCYHVSRADGGFDFPQPADLTILHSSKILGEAAGSQFLYAGDCEDHAILRASLLRAMGMAPWAIWIVNLKKGTFRHEYNLVLYEGAFRIMELDPIKATLDLSRSEVRKRFKTYYGWNEIHGPRGREPQNHQFLLDYVDNYPGGKDDGKRWSYRVYSRKIVP
ncbi:hypothetical protein ACFL6R_05530 [Gemmatimonadota bacterium]